MKKIQHAFTNFREVFDRHFTSTGEAQLFEDRALAGDDRAQVRLWKLYQDGYLTEELGRKAEGSYSLRPHHYHTMHVVCPEAAAYFRACAQRAHHPEATSFAEGVQLGRRDCMSRYAIYRDGLNDFYGGYYLQRLEILGNSSGTCLLSAGQIRTD